MALLGNILWFIAFGWWCFLLYALEGVICCITIIGIPIGKALFQYAKLMALPFGKVIIKETELKGKENVSAVRRVCGVIANIIWLPVGIIMFLGNIGLILVCCISIIGIPFAIVLAKSCIFLLWPVGAKVITKEEAETLRMEQSMIKVMGTAVAVNNMMTTDQSVSATAIPQNTNTAQPNQFLENLQENGGKAVTAFKDASGKAVDSLRENGGKTLDSLRENGGKAVTAIAATGSEGFRSLREKQQEISKQMFEKQDNTTLEELLKRLEVKFYHNKIMAWIMPFLEYITLGAGIVFILIGLILERNLLYGILMGLMMAAPFMLIAALLGMIKRNHIFTLIVLGSQLAVNLITWIAAHAGAADFIFKIICYIGIIAWYVYTFVADMGTANAQAQMQSVILPKRTGAAATGAKQSFCAHCGMAYTGKIKFCSKCGTSLNP